LDECVLKQGALICQTINVRGRYNFVTVATQSVNTLLVGTYQQNVWAFAQKSTPFESALLIAIDNDKHLGKLVNNVIYAKT
jgi:hypothetical protein